MVSETAMPVESMTAMCDVPLSLRMKYCVQVNKRSQ